MSEKTAKVGEVQKPVVPPMPTMYGALYLPHRYRAEGHWQVLCLHTSKERAQNDVDGLAVDYPARLITIPGDET